jgi:hypothetical protein
MLEVPAFIMLIIGVWAIVTGRISPKLLGGGPYEIKGRSARLLGGLLVLPIPVVLLGDVILISIFGEDAYPYMFFLGIITIYGTGLAAIVLTRRIRKPLLPTSSQVGYEVAIDKKAKTS